MKTLIKACLLPLLLHGIGAVAESASPADELSYRFDNGAGWSGSSTYSSFNSRHGVLSAHNGSPVGRFLLHQDYGAGALHYGGLTSGDENHVYGGMTLGPATLALFQGEGESFSRAPNPLFGDLDQYFFHGGSRTSFSIRGVSAHIRHDDGISTQLAVSRVTAEGLEKRSSYYLGMTNRKLEAGVFRMARGGVATGTGLSLGYRGDGLDIDYQEIASEYDARLRRLSFQLEYAPQRSFSLALEQAENALFPSDGEQRIMFRFRARFGGPAFSAAESGEESAGGEEGFGKAVGIGVGIAVAAVAVSSGSGDSDSARRFAVRNDAAFDVLNRINPASVRQNREHGGWIYRNADNTFAATQPVAGTVASVNIGAPAKVVPRGSRASASYHTHGGPDPRYDNENFSPQDILADNISGTDGYLGTPAGFMKLHDVETGKISIVGRINN